MIDTDYVPTYDESDNKGDNKQPDNADMPDLETKESAEERRIKEDKD